MRVRELRLAWRVRRADLAGYVGYTGFLLMNTTIIRVRGSVRWGYACSGRVCTHERATCINDGGKHLSYKTPVMLVLRPSAERIEGGWGAVGVR